MSQIYTLQSAATAHLEELWYVGRTTNILERFAKHQRGSGARCLVGRSNIVMTRLEKETPFLELVRTLELMTSYGPAKVRGGPFVRQQHSFEDLATIKNLLESESFARSSDSETSPTETSASVEKRSRAESTGTLIDEEIVSQARAGKPWTAEEHTAFRNLILDGASRDVAERKMQRKITALDAMARKLITMRLGSGHSMDDICEFLKKSPDQVQGILSGNSFFE